MSSRRAPSNRNVLRASPSAGPAQSAPAVAAQNAPTVAVPAQMASVPDESVRNDPATTAQNMAAQIISASATPATTTTTGNSPAPVVPSQTPPTANEPLPASAPKPPSTPSDPVPPALPPPPILNDTVNELVIVSDRDTYDQLLTDAGRKHLLLEFFAPWCGACMLINRKLEELLTTYKGKLIIAKVNIDDCEQIAIDNEVTMMPSFVLIKENQVLERFAGSNEDKLVSILKKYVGEPMNSGEEANGPQQ
ncbi:uncharacterized protein LOC129238651 [Anastrepha obliqua]|uniref:uncharacterized protein LOC129238651 n=1 Tax=Anastrepha obliqua TaxID=95512 RepID=UPI002409178D|nr:uncharacterized protein LOC129238651 [Anastrepha obliqua]